jgi:LmbE family N-acetylglucosaminyl deacetylase
MVHLFISPHPDDAEIGCGGLIAKLAQEGEEVHILYLTNGDAGINNTDPQEASLIRVHEASNACQLLGVEKYSFAYQPDTAIDAQIAGKGIAIYCIENNITNIYVTNLLEQHPDHCNAAMATLFSLDHLERRPIIHYYEVWTPLTRISMLIDITAQVGLKRAAIRCHRSQDAPNDFSSAILALNHYRGIMHGPNMMYAEAYQLADL